MPVSEILPDFFFFERGYLNGNHFAWRGERPVLVDTAYLPHVDATLEILAGIGVDPTRTAQILTTHCHCDHVGGHRRIQALSGCGVALHPLGRHFIETGDDWSTWWRYYDQPAEPFECTHSLEDGEVVDVGPHRFTVLHTPGHSADGLVLYCAAERVLLSADALWQKDVPVMTVRVEGSRTLFDALISLERIEALDVRRVYPGHGPGFDDMPAAVARSRERLRGYLRELGFTTNQVEAVVCQRPARFDQVRARLEGDGVVRCGVPGVHGEVQPAGTSKVSTRPQQCHTPFGPMRGGRNSASGPLVSTRTQRLRIRRSRSCGQRGAYRASQGPRTTVTPADSRVASTPG